MRGGNFANGAISGAFAFVASAGIKSIMTDAGVTGSGEAGDADAVEVPESVKVEESGFGTAEAAAKAVAEKYGQIGVDNEPELQIGIIKLGKNDWGYLTPGWAPVGSTIVAT